MGHNVKGAGAGHHFTVYTQKEPLAKLDQKISSADGGSDGASLEQSPHFGHQMELNPMMLTVLGVVSGILIVIVLVAIAVKVSLCFIKSHFNFGMVSQGTQWMDAFLTSKFDVGRSI